MWGLSWDPTAPLPDDATPAPAMLTELWRHSQRAAPQILTSRDPGGSSMVRDGCEKERKQGVNPTSRPGDPEFGAAAPLLGPLMVILGKRGILWENWDFGERKVVFCLPIHLLGDI